MNRNNLLIASFFVATMFAVTSCQHIGKSRTVIATNNNGSVMRLEYSGTVVFNEQKTGVDYISDEGFLKYEHNGEKIEAKSDGKGKIKYEYNGSEVTKLNEPGKALLVEAVGAISSQQAKVKAEERR